MTSTSKGIVLKLISTVLFTVMAALVRFLGARYPIGEVVFYRSAFAIVPVLAIYAWRGELASVVRTERPLGQAGRGIISIIGMFCNFGAAARLPLDGINAISFTSPLFSVALAALVLKERVRIYRWSAVIIGFLGVLVVLSPHVSGDELVFAVANAATVAGLIFALTGAFANAGTVIQTRRLTQSETTSSIVFYFSLSCALAGLVTWPFGWISPSGTEFAGSDQHRHAGRHRAHLLTESYRYASASIVAPFDYTVDDLGADPGLRHVRRGADAHDRSRLPDHRRGGTIRDLARAAIGGGQQARRADAASDGSRHGYDGPNTLKVMMVRVSAMPAMDCTFSATKCPISVPDRHRI